MRPLSRRIGVPRGAAWSPSGCVIDRAVRGNGATSSVSMVRPALPPCVCRVAVACVRAAAGAAALSRARRFLCCWLGLALQPERRERKGREGKAKGRRLKGRGSGGRRHTNDRGWLCPHGVGCSGGGRFSCGLLEWQQREHGTQHTAQQGNNTHTHTEERNSGEAGTGGTQQGELLLSPLASPCPALPVSRLGSLCSSDFAPCVFALFPEWSQIIATVTPPLSSAFTRLVVEPRRSPPPPLR
jgi:hypothetical protein